MLLTELQTYSLTHLTNNPFSSATSADNSFAFITEKGLDVLELSPDPKSVSPSLSCRRYVIKSPSSLPTADVGVAVGELLPNLDRDDAYSLIKDVTVSPHLPRTMAPVPTPRSVAWSPISILPNQRCLLAILTDTGGLSLYALIHHEYRQVRDVSDIWLAHCRDSWTGKALPRSSSHKLAEAKRRADIVKLTALCWLDETSGGTGWLAAGSKSGLVTLWRVQAGETLDSVLSVSYVSQLQTNISNITCLNWTTVSESNCLISVGGMDGRVCCYTLPFPSNIKTEPLSEPEGYDMWAETDRIAPSQLVCWPWRDGTLLVAVKGAFVIALHLNESGEKLSYAAYRSCDTSVNGLTRLSGDRMLVVTRSARFTQLTVSQHDGKLVFTTELVESYINISHMGCYGLNLSQNGVICFILLSVNQSYDHLRLREPTQVVVCSVSGHVDPQAMLLAPQRPIAQLWDCLELIRVQVLQKVFVPELSLSRSALDTMAIDQLICTLWWVTFVAAVEDDEAKLQELVMLHQQLETLVTSCHFFKRIALLINCPPDSLSTFQLLSLSLLRKWLLKLLTLPEDFSTTLITGKTLLQQLNGIVDKLPDEELCDICGSIVKDKPALLFSECEMGHSLPRCSLSLVQCSQLPYYVCAQCGCLAHPLAAKECGIACILCGGVLRLDEDIVT